MLFQPMAMKRFSVNFVVAVLLTTMTNTTRAEPQSVENTKSYNASSNSNYWTSIPALSFDNPSWRVVNPDHSQDLKPGEPKAYSRIPTNRPPPSGKPEFGFQTQRFLSTPEPLRRADCASDEECADYSGLPRFKPHPGSGVKGIRKPYLGLSVTTPIQ